MKGAPRQKSSKTSGVGTRSLGTAFDDDRGRDPFPLKRTSDRWPLAIGLATFALHGLVAWLFPLPGAFRKYSLAAEQYLAGELPLERLVDFSAFYFDLSVLAERLLPWPEAALTWLQLALAAASVALVFSLLERRLGAGWAAVAALAMALDRHLLVYARILEPEVCLLFFLLAFLWLLDRETHVPFAGDLAPWLAGGSAALCLAIRPTFLPAFLLVPFYYRLRGLSGPLKLRRGRPWLGKPFCFLVPVAAMLLLLAVRAFEITGDPRTPMMNPGTVFFEGNNPLSQGTSAIYPPVVLAYVRHTGEEPDPAHRHYRTVARAAMADGDPTSGHELTVSEVNAYWSELALQFIRDHPSRWLQLLGVKLKRAFHGFRWHDVPPAWKLDQRLFFVPAVPFALLSALAFAGALFEVRRWRESLLYYALAAIQLAVMLVFYVSARQRLVLLPALLYFAAIAARRLVRERAWPALVLVALLALSFSLPDDAMADESYRRRGWRETEARLEQVREKSRAQPLALHAELAVEAVASAPWWLDWLRPAYFPHDEGTLEERVARLLASRPRTSPAADFDLAAVHLEAGQLAEARRLLEPLSERDHFVYRGGRHASQPLTLLGRATALAGDRDGAIDLLERALERAPGDPFTLAELIALGEVDYQEPLLRAWSQIDAYYLLGRALLVHGQHREAARALHFVISRLPDFRDARVLLAAALGASDQIVQGARHYQEATRHRPEPILAGTEISRLFRRWAAIHPESPRVSLYAAQVLHHHGHFAEALAMLEALEPPVELEDAVAREMEGVRRALGEAASPR